MPGSDIDDRAPWSLTKRVLFRFAVGFFLLVNLPALFELIPSQSLMRVVTSISDPPVQAVARALHLSVDARPNGSGDTTYNWVNLLCVTVAAAVIALIWSVVDRRRPRYDKAWIAFRAYLRFMLAMAMISYGAFKVIPTQFPPPTLDRLMQPFGDASPMGLLWTFMGASATYTIFTGAAEMLGGLLLTTRRTTLLGALISMGVLVNIVALNFMYDVPVKIYSLQLLTMAFIIALPDFPRLFDFFVRNRAVEPAPLPHLTQSRAAEIAGIVLRTLAVAAVVVMALKQANEIHRMIDAPRHSPLYGIWRVDDFQVDGRPIPAGADPWRWRRLIFDSRFIMAIQLMNDSRQRMNVQLDEKKRTLVVSRRNEPAWDGRFTYGQPDPGTLTIDGTLGGRNIHALCHREPIPAFLLTTRGFHWVNESPFNR
ncbi:MAG TPA: hypothetical protein VLC46_21345 [Thermoanaerobaculia bacterium]|jgi:hypothetical protein|nr:hypothetical protein [Thermoanaerobaculia bacterium]